MLPIICCRIALAAVALSVFGVLPATGQTINEDLKLLASDRAADDRFGTSIAIDNGIVAVGAQGNNDNGIDSGSAYLFDAATGEQLFKFLPGDGAAEDWFGNSIAIANGIVAVGAAWNDDNGINSGSAYLFDASTGNQLFKLLPSDGGQDDRFGNSIAINNGIVAVGAARDRDNGPFSGSAYLFDAATGEQLFKLLPSDGASLDAFGSSIAIDNGIVAVGAKFDDDNGTASGSAYLFDAATGVQLAKLLSNDGAPDDRFGWSIAIANGVVAVGAVWNDDNGPFSGSAYLFDAATGVQLAKLLPNDGAGGDFFGNSIAIANGVVAVGAAWNDDNGTSSGSAYLFDAATGVQLAKLLPNDGAADDEFGSSIGIDNGFVAVGAVGDDDNGTDSGSAYLFDIRPCLADLTGDGIVDTLDFLLYLGAWAQHDPLADWNDDGTVNTQDFLAYLNDWVAGCP